MSRLGWYSRRLRSMGVREVLSRATRSAKALRSRVADAPHVSDLIGSHDSEVILERFRSGVDRPVLLDRQRAQAIRDDNPAFVASLVGAADRAVQNSFQFFGYPAVTLTSPIDWHYDPLSDIHWPNLPSRRINHRVGAGDVKWIWELNRLQHLPWLAQAWLFTGDSRYERAAFEHLDSWIEQNEPGHGIAWRGAFEAGIRAISIAIAVQGFRDSAELTRARFDRILTIMAQSGERCWNDRSLFSSANNHLVGEMAGLAVIALLFPELAASSEWEASAVSMLSAEAGKQILADGAGAEQAIGYQLFTVELLHLVATLLTQRDGHAPKAITDAITRSALFLTVVIGDQDPAPRYGDDDGGFALRLGPEPVRTVREHLGLVSPCSWGVAAGGVGADTLTAQWYQSMNRSCSVEPAVDSAAQGVEQPSAFYARNGGLVVLRDGRRRTTMDIGPLGYLSIAAHGHADALAVTLSIDGQDLISDPGTGSYYGHPDWRRSMRSTRAHATVSIDGQDQSINGGSFMWAGHARTRVHRIDLDAGVVDAEHDGYTRLPGRPIHRRWLIARPGESAQLVVDMITGAGVHEVRSSWPLHPSLDIQRTEFGHSISRNGSTIAQLQHASTASLAIDEVRGDRRQNLGWWSERLESRIPAWWLSAVANAELPILIATLINPMDGPVAQDLAVDLKHDEITAHWEENGTIRTVNIPISDAGLPEIPRALWVSTSMSTRGGISTYVRNMRSTELWRQWNITHVSTHRNGAMATRVAVFAVGYSRFVWQLSTNRPQIVHIHMSSYGSFARKFMMMWTAKAFRVPVVLHVHGSQFNEFSVRAPRAIRRLIRATLERADAVIALGNAWAADLHRIAPLARIDVVPNAIRPNQPVPHRRHNPIHIVFLGELGERKGTFVLLEAWARLTAHLGTESARLTLAGDGEVDRARALTSSLNIDASVDIRGWLSEADVEALLSDAQVLVLPSLHEGQPMAILEAMSRGMCVIASDVGGIPEMLGESGGILVSPGDVEALSAALQVALTNDDLRSHYGAAALQRTEGEFNIDLAAGRIDRLYRTIMQRRDSGRLAP